MNENVKDGNQQVSIQEQQATQLSVNRVRKPLRNRA